MIQRIQSVYLLIVCILLGTLFVYPFAELLASNGQLFVYNFNGLTISGEEKLYLLTVPPVILLSITVFIALMSIFLYKKRILQMRLSSFNIILMIGFVGLNYYYLHNFSKQLDGVISYQIAAVFPLIAAILSFLAVRAIGKDEALVRSMDRIR